MQNYKNHKYMDDIEADDVDIDAIDIDDLGVKDLWMTNFCKVYSSFFYTRRFITPVRDNLNLHLCDIFSVMH